MKPAEVLRVVPSPVDFGSVEVGESKTLVVSVANVGRATLDVRVADVSPPFFLEPGTAQSTLRSGQSLFLPLRFSPIREGAEDAALRFDGAGGELLVPVSGLGVVCLSANSCASSHYDAAAQACVELPRRDGWPCANACGAGRCSGGLCVVAPEVCDDGLACTSDACDAESGCQNALSCADDGDVCTTEVCLADGGCGAVPVPCDDGNPCTEDGCDAQSGCSHSVRPDETPCAAPTCETHFYCSSGTCTPVGAPDAGPCGCHPQLVPPPRLAVGTGNACRVTPEKSVECWGFDGCGQLGGGTVTGECVYDSAEYWHTQPSPLPVQGLSDVEEVSGGNYNVFCARTTGGDVYCWGHNSVLVAPSPPWWIVPPKKMPLANAVALSVGESHACAVLADGTVWCWGANHRGELGMGYAGYTPDAGCVDCRRLNPVRVVGINNAVRVNTTGQGVTCAILSDSTVRCWGVSLIPGAEVTCIRKWGSEYDPRFETHQPVLLRDIDGGALYGITKVFTTSSVGSGRTCTLDMYGRLSCVIGESPAVPLLEPFVGTQNCELFVPVEVPFCASRFRMAQGGYAFRLRDGTARVLATANDAGALGTGDYEPAYAFREVSGLHDAEEVEIEGLHGCATLTDGGFRCWGDNTWGQLGDGTYVSRPAP